MATVIDELITVLSFRGDAEGIKNTRTQLRSMSDDISTAARGLGILGGAITAVGVGALTQFVPFEDRLATIKGLVGVTNEELADMTPRLHEIGAATGVGPQALADALFFITSNGLRAAGAMETVERSAIAQAVGLGDAETSARLATSAINAYGEENLSATMAFDDLTAAVRLGNLQTDAMAGSMGRLIPIASGMGVEFGEAAGLLAALSRTGTEADQGVTQLTQVLVSLLNPSAEADDALEAVGLSASQLRRHIADEGLLNTLILLRNTFGDNEDAMTAVFGNVRALRGVFDLLGPNLSVTQSIMADMADTAGELDGAFQRSETSGRNIRRTMSDLQSGAIALGDALAPIIDMFLGPLSAGIRRFTELLESDNTAVRIVAQSVFVLGFGLIALSATLFGVAGAMRIFAFSIAPVTALVNFLQASLILLRIQLLAMAIASHAATAATWLLNIALYANPIGLIILAVIALIAAVIGVAYVIWRFRDAIIDGLGYAWNWVKDNWPLLLAYHIRPVRPRGVRHHPVQGPDYRDHPRSDRQGQRPVARRLWRLLWRAWQCGRESSVECLASKRAGLCRGQQERHGLPSSTAGRPSSPPACCSGWRWGQLP